MKLGKLIRVKLPEDIVEEIFATAEAESLKPATKLRQIVGAAMRPTKKGRK